MSGLVWGVVGSVGWGVLIGYLVGSSTLLMWWRGPRERNALILGGILANQIDVIEPEFGLVEGDSDFWNEWTQRGRRRQLWGWRWWYVTSCNVCSGLWAGLVGYGLWVTGSVFSGVDVGSWPVVVGAAGLVGAGTVVVSETGNRLKVWG